MANVSINQKPSRHASSSTPVLGLDTESVNLYYVNEGLGASLRSPLGVVALAGSHPDFVIV